MVGKIPMCTRKIWKGNQKNSKNFYNSPDNIRLKEVPSRLHGKQENGVASRTSCIHKLQLAWGSRGTLEGKKNLNDEKNVY